jgi:D-3-phosphoglycerate dehydrogenase
VRDALLRGELSRSINVAGVSGDQWSEFRPALTLARHLGAVGRAVLATQGARAIDRVDVSVGEALAGARDALLAAAAVGVLSAVVAGERLNLINARTLAAARGIALGLVDEAHEGEENGGPAHSVTVRLAAGERSVALAGVAHPAALPRVTRIGAFHVDVHPRGTLIILTNHDVPGVIGHVGTVLGQARVNIAEYHQARLAQGGEALAAIAVDGRLDGDAAVALSGALEALPDVRSAAVISLPAE